VYLIRRRAEAGPAYRVLFRALCSCVSGNVEQLKVIAGPGLFLVFQVFQLFGEGVYQPVKLGELAVCI
jgi:hypothetical protein